MKWQPSLTQRVKSISLRLSSCYNWIVEGKSLTRSLGRETVPLGLSSISMVMSFICKEFRYFVDVF